jgi:hypothetical protein
MLERSDCPSGMLKLNREPDCSQLAEPLPGIRPFKLRFNQELTRENPDSRRFAMELSQFWSFFEIVFAQKDYGSRYRLLTVEIHDAVPTEKDRTRKLTSKTIVGRKVSSLVLPPGKMSKQILSCRVKASNSDRPSEMGRNRSV